MKKIKLVTFALLALTVVAGLFAPYLLVDGNYYSAFEILRFLQINGLFALIFVAFGIVFIGTILLAFGEKKKWIPYVSFLLLLGGAIIFSFSKAICKASVSYSDSLVVYVSPVIMAFVGLGEAIYATRLLFDGGKLDVRDMAEIAIFVSFAFVLDLPIFKLKIVANGGSISLIMLPLIMLSLRKGFFKGFIGAGIVFGLVSCLLDGYGLITYPLDYLLGFGAMAIVGLFRKQILGKEKLHVRHYLILLGVTILAMAVRTLASTLSGIFIYGLDFMGSLVYQLTYMGPSFIVVGIVLVILLYPLNKLSLKKR